MKAVRLILLLGLFSLFFVGCSTSAKTYFYTSNSSNDSLMLYVNDEYVGVLPHQSLDEFKVLARSSSMSKELDKKTSLSKELSYGKYSIVAKTRDGVEVNTMWLTLDKNTSNSGNQLGRSSQAARGLYHRKVMINMQ